MRTRLASLVIVVLSVFGGVTAGAQPLADRIPGDALIYVGWSGSDSMGPGYDGSHLKAVLDASKFSELVSLSIPRLLKRVGASDREAGEIAELLAAIGGPMWRHPTAFYFGGLDTSNPNGQPVPKIAMLCEAGGDGKALAERVRKALANVPPDAGVKVDEQGGAVLVSIGATGWGIGQRPAAALPASKAFQSALAQVQKDPVASVYVDVEGIVKLVDQLIPADSPPGQSWAGIRDALGLGGIKRVIWTSGFDGKDWMSRAFVDAPAPRKGAFPAMLDARPLSTDIMKAIPQSVTLAMAGKFDLGGLVSAIRSAATKVDPQVGQMVDGFFRQANEAVGFDLQADLLNQLGDEWAFYVDPMSTGNGLMGFSIVNRARDAAKVEASLSKLEKLANRAIQENIPPDGPTVSFREARTLLGTLHTFSVPLVNPTWGVRDGNLYLALYPQGVNGAMEHVAVGGRSLLDNEDFKAIRNRLGGGAPDSINFADLPKTAPSSYGEFISIAQLYLGFADLFDAHTPALLFPPLKKVMPHLAPAGGLSWVDEAGWHSKNVSPFPGSEALGSGGGSLASAMVGQNALMISILLPSLNRARETAHRVKCGSNMRQIGQAILLYSNENRGKYPTSLGQLVLTQDVTWEVFVCPSAKQGPPPPPGAKPDDIAKWVIDHSDYVYLGSGMNSTAGAEVIVLYEKPDDHSRQGMNMLFGDGHVEFQQMPSAMKMIEAQKAGGAKKGGRL